MDGYSLLDVKFAYIAGLLDGEGSIAPYVVKGYYGISVSITNTNRAALEFVAALFEHEIQALDRKGNRKILYRWFIGGTPAAKMLEKLLPYLVIKKQRAILAIQLIYVAPQQRQELAEEIKRLNKTSEDDANVKSD